MYDEHYHEYLQDQALTDLYEEFKVQAIEEFTVERLRTYYLENRCLAKPAVDFLADAHNLVAKNSTAGFLFSVIAIESGLKSTLLKPLVCGLVHTSSIAELIADSTLSHTGVDRFRDRLFRLLDEHGKIDLDDYKRSKSKKILWQEIKEVQKLRNRVMHRAESVSRDQADFSICVGSAILETIFPSIVAEMDLHLHDGYRICNDWRCRNREIAERLAK